MHPSTATSRVHRKPPAQSVIRLLTSCPSPAPLLLVNHLLVHLLPLKLLFAGDCVLELFDILVKELFLCLLLVFRVVALVRDQLHHGVHFLWLGFQIGDDSWLLVHLA